MAFIQLKSRDPPLLINGLRQHAEIISTEKFCV